MDSVVRTAVYGGSFNPPHVGHVFACTWALVTGEVDRVLVVPCFVHPFAKPLAPFEERFVMAELAMGWLPGVTVSRVEQELGGESRTLRTVRHVRQQHPDESLRLLVGADVLTESAKWQGFNELIALAPPLVLGRQGVAYDAAMSPSLPNVSSSEIRRLLGAGATNTLRSMVPANVLAHVEARGLYRQADA